MIVRKGQRFNVATPTGNAVMTLVAVRDFDMDTLIDHMLPIYVQWLMDFGVAEPAVKADIAFSEMMRDMGAA